MTRKNPNVGSFSCSLETGHCVAICNTLRCMPHTAWTLLPSNLYTMEPVLDFCFDCLSDGLRQTRVKAGLLVTLANAILIKIGQYIQWHMESI